MTPVGPISTLSEGCPLPWGNGILGKPGPGIGSGDAPVKEQETYLQNIATQWSRVFQAGTEEGDASTAARHQLLIRYQKAVLRFLQAELRDEHAAADLLSNFAIRVLEIDSFLRKADPHKGRFRDYLKAVLHRMVLEHFRRSNRETRRRQGIHEGTDSEPAVETEAWTSVQEERYRACFRAEVVQQAWQVLEETERTKGKPYATLIRLEEDLRARDADTPVRSADLARELTVRLGRPFTDMAVRQMRHRAREYYGELLVREVARTLEIDRPGVEDARRIEDSLIDLGLFNRYGKEALRRWCPAAP